MTTSRGALALGVVCIAQSLWVLDLSLVTVILPSIRHDLGADIELVPVSFALAFGAALTIGGRLADRFSERTMIAAGTFLFATASLLASLADSLGALVGARVVAGVAAGLVVPATFGMIGALYDRADARARALAVCGAVISLAFTAGALLGGFLTDAYSWRTAVQLGLIPVSLLTAGLTRALPAGVGTSDHDPLPIAPALIASVAVAGGLVAIDQFTAQHGDRGLTSASAALALLALLGLLISRDHWAIRDRAPLLSLRLVAPNLAGLFLVAAGDAVLYLVTLHAQDGVGFTARFAGFAFAALGLSSLLGGIVGGALIPRVGSNRVVIPAFLIQSLAISGLALSFDHRSLLIITMAAFGFGNMLALVGIAELTLSAAPRHLHASAGAVLQTSQQFGAALGVGFVGLLTAEGSRHLDLALLLATIATLFGLGLYATTKAQLRRP